VPGSCWKKFQTKGKEAQNIQKLQRHIWMLTLPSSYFKSLLLLSQSDLQSVIESKKKTAETAEISLAERVY
jgi:hypothetical protein